MTLIMNFDGPSYPHLSHVIDLWVMYTFLKILHIFFTESAHVMPLNNLKHTKL